MEPQISAAIGCPQCGSPFDFREGARNAVCTSCKTPLTISGQSGVSRFYLEEKLDLAEARSAVRKFVATHGVDTRLVDRLRFERGELCFLPFWSLRGHAVGWLWSERETMVKEENVDENGMKVVRELRGPNERRFETITVDTTYSSPACDLGRFGLTGIAIASTVLPLKVVNFEALTRRGTVIDALKGPDQVRAEALALARNRLDTSRVKQQKSSLNLVGERLALISYPVWSLTFSVGDRTYPVTVDAVNARLLKGRFPAPASIRIFIPLLTVAILTFAVTSHGLLGGVALVAFLAYLATTEGLSLQSLVTHFCLLIKRGEEVEIG